MIPRVEVSRLLDDDDGPPRQGPLRVVAEAAGSALPLANAAPDPFPAVSKAVSGVARDAFGRFVPGTCGGPGRPAQPTLRKLMAARVGDESVNESMAEVFACLLEAARNGDTAAAKILLDHLVDRDTAIGAAGGTLQLVVVNTGADG